MNHLQLFENFDDDDEDYITETVERIAKNCISYKNPLLTLISRRGDEVLLSDVSKEDAIAYIQQQPNNIMLVTIKVEIREANPADEVPELLQPLYQKAAKFKEPKFVILTPTGSIYCTSSWAEIIKGYRSRISSGYNPAKMERWLKDYDVYGDKKPTVKRPIRQNGYNHPSELSPAQVEFGKKQNIITSDGTDVVRLCRILDTENEERYEEGPMTVYRSVVGYTNIRPGDWVSPYREYAELHNDSNLGGKGNIVEMEVDGRDVLVSPTGNHEEAIYAPLELSKPYEFYRKGRRKK